MVTLKMIKGGRSTSKKYEAMLEGIKQVSALTDVARTLNYEQFNHEAMIDYFNASADILLKVRNMAIELQKELGLSDNKG